MPYMVYGVCMYYTQLVQVEEIMINNENAREEEF